MSMYEAGGIMEILLHFIFFMSGSCLASFIECMAFQISHSCFRMRSRCAECGHVLAWYDLIPVFSYLILRGRCRSCGSRISTVHPVSEIACGLYCAALYRHSGLTAVLAGRVLLMSVLVYAAFYDMYTMEIPDICLVLQIMIFFVFEQRDCTQTAARVIPAAAAALYVSAAAMLFYVFRKQSGIGFGDIKLYFVCGLYLTFQQVMTLIAVSGLLGVVCVLASGKKKIPFGPCIAAAFLVLILYV